MMVAAYIKEDTDIKEEESDYDEYEYDCAMTRMRGLFRHIEEFIKD